jgi:predicted RNase H-like HicB family nuclease
MTILAPLKIERCPKGRVVECSWSRPNHRYEFNAIACPEEEDGGYSIFALNYPGVISQGENLEEARQNIADAFLAVLEARRDRGEEMEFSYNPVVDVTENCKHLRVTVDA